MSTATMSATGLFNVLYFASAGSYTGKDAETFQGPLPLRELFNVLERKYEGIRSKVLESCLITVNLEYVDVNDTPERQVILQPGDEVAVIPPVSSG